MIAQNADTSEHLAIEQSQKQGVFLRYLPTEIEGECILLSVRPVRFILWRFIIFCVHSILLIGIPILLTYWYPILKRYFYYSFCPFNQQCSHFLIQNHDQTYEIAIRKKTRFYQTEIKPYELDYFNQRYLKYTVNAGQVKVCTFNFIDRVARVSQPGKQPSGLGLTEEQADNLKSCYGPGTMIIEKPNLLVLLFREVVRPLYLFMIFSVSLWTYEEYYYYAGVIFFSSAVAITIQLYEVNALNKKIFQMAYYETKVNVLRNGKVQERSSLELVPGDITFLKNPEKVPFDGVLLEGSALINECALTGESVPIVKKASPLGQFGRDKQADKNAFVYEGTTIIQVNDKKPVSKFERYRVEYGLPVCVIRTNFITMKGQLIRLISFPKETENKFQRESAKFLLFLFSLAVLTYILLIIRLHQVVEGTDLFVKFLDLITITVPPGLPISMTIGIVFALQKLKKKEIFCISPDKVIVGGSVNYVCFDKTGTLTEDYMNFHSLVPSHEARFEESVDPDSKKEKTLANLVSDKPYLSAALGNMACNHSVIKLQSTGELIGDPMEINSLQFGQFEFEDSNSNVQVLYSMKSKHTPTVSIYRRFEFDADLQRMGVVAQSQKSNSYTAYFKGSPEMMLKIMKPSSIPTDYSQMLGRYASMGLRLLAIASKEIKLSKDQIRVMNRDEIERDIIFNGFQIFENKLKSETSGAIEELFSARVPCVMITGDNPLTGSNIAYKCHIASIQRKMIIIDLDRDGKLIQSDFVFKDMDEEEAQRRKVKSKQDNTQTMYNMQLGDLAKPSQRATADDEGAATQSTHENPIHIFLACIVSKGKAQNCQFCLTGAAFNSIFPGEIKTLNLIEAEFISQVRVFARAKPNDKARIIMVYQNLGKITAMCGDGANDCGALKQADVGLSLSQAEASISSPFTSKVANIGSMVELLKECRAGLATNFSLFNIMAIYSLIQYTVTVISQYFYAYPSDFQYLYWDLACNFFFFLVIGYTSTADKLCIERPSASLFALSNLCEVMTMALIQVLGQITIILALGGIFAEPIDYYNVAGSETNKARYLDQGDFLTGTWETNSLFLFTNFLYIFSMLAFNISKPWRKEFFTNIPLMIILFIVYTYSFIIVLVPAARLVLFQVTDHDYLPLNGFILGMANLFGIAMFINQKYILENLFGWLKRTYPDKKWI